MLTDDFNGDNAHLVRGIEALIAMNDSGSLVPHGIGDHARTLLSAAAVRLSSPPAGEGEPLGYAVEYTNGTTAFVRFDPTTPGDWPFRAIFPPTALDYTVTTLYAHPPSPGEEKTGEREAVERLRAFLKHRDGYANRMGAQSIALVRVYGNPPDGVSLNDCLCADIAAILAISPTSGGGTGEPDWDEFRTILEAWIDDLSDTLGARHQEGGGGASDEERDLLRALSRVHSAAPSPGRASG